MTYDTKIYVDHANGSIVTLFELRSNVDGRRVWMLYQLKLFKIANKDWYREHKLKM